MLGRTTGVNYLRLALRRLTGTHAHPSSDGVTVHHPAPVNGRNTCVQPLCHCLHLFEASLDACFSLGLDFRTSIGRRNNDGDSRVLTRTVYSLLLRTTHQSVSSFNRWHWEGRILQHSVLEPHTL
jgi:hypothetical protein